MDAPKDNSSKTKVLLSAVGEQSVTSRTHYLAIEKEPTLLQEYGRCVALINAVEWLLEQVISFRGGLSTVDQSLREQLLGSQMLGRKIDIAKPFLRVAKTDELTELNRKRAILAHGATFQEIVGADVAGEFVIHHKSSDHKVTPAFFEEIVLLADRILADLRMEFTAK